MWRKIVTVLSFIMLQSTVLHAETDRISKQAHHLLQHMSLAEKIGQKIMLDVRYWCDDDATTCTQDFTAVNPTVTAILTTHHIGGLIVFANNLKTISQITTLTHTLQQNMRESDNLPLLVSTDQEGGIVARLPRDQSVTFAGNMALAAAYLSDTIGVQHSGEILGADLAAVGINVDFAPDVDVNVNPQNPVIHVRSFSDDSQLVATLGLQMTRALQSQHIAATLKHFPGHGDTVTDSHIGLPVVDHSLQEAWELDLFPFASIIARQGPDLIMTAHIQFPALDDSTVVTKSGERIVTPATLSRRIQFNLLRQQLHYQGVVVTDALDMGAIAKNFDPVDATLKAFQAGDDIALMPVVISHPQDEKNLQQVIAAVMKAVDEGKIDAREVDESVLRIIKLKLRLGLLHADTKSLAEKITKANAVLTNPADRAYEKAVTDAAITVVQNHDATLPLHVQAGTRIHILTPWSEQGAGLQHEMLRLQARGLLPALQVSMAKMADVTLAQEKAAVDAADVVIVGDSTTKLLSASFTQQRLFAAGNFLPMTSLVFPELLAGDGRVPAAALKVARSDLADAAMAYAVLAYATQQHKKTIFISLLAPYDLPSFQTVAAAMMVGYDHYGFLGDEKDGYERGPSMGALVRVMFGLVPAVGKLPIAIPDPADMTQVVFPRGFGLTL